MSGASRITLLQSMRTSRLLRVIFALTGLFWMVSATACALHDVSGNCDYSVSIVQAHSGDTSDGADHVPCCPHPLSVQLLVFQADLPAKSFIASGSVAMPSFIQSYRSYLQSPPTPPPIAG